MINFDSLLSFDTEDDSKGNFILGVIYNGREFFVFREKTKMKDFLCSHYSRNKIYFAHNCLYDLMNIFEKHELELHLNNGKLIKAMRRSGKNNTLFYDTLNYIPISLEKVGNIIDCKKLKMEKRNLMNYCKRDAEICRKWVIEFLQFMIKKYSISRISPTLTGYAWKIFHKYYNLPVKCRQYEEEARDSYYGGRVEIFRHGFFKGQVFENDVNSMYPSVMYNIILPYPDMRSSKNLHIGSEGIAKVFVENNLALPVLAKRIEKKLIFPSGKFWTVATMPELRYFVENEGKILRTEYCIYSDRTYNHIFNRYVMDFYKMKQTATNDLNKQIAKLFLNSLYGKFGIKGEGEKLVELSDKEYFEDGIIFGNDAVYGFEKTEFETNYQNVYFASYITALARLKLHNLLVKNYSTALYCDTDSILSSAKIADKSDIMGELSFKGVHKDGFFLLPKLYLMGETVKSKGLRLKNGKDFYEFLNTKKAFIEKPVRLKESIRTGQKVNYWIKQEKSLNAEYNKRIILRGGETTPIELNENQEE